MTEEMELRICELYEHYETAREVSEIVGYSNESVRRVLEKHGIPRTHGHPKAKSSAGNNRKNIDRERVGELYRSGVSVHSIAKRLGCSDSVIYYHLGKLGLYKIGQRKKKFEALTQQIIELHKQGMSDREIADALGCISKDAVHNRVRKVFGPRGRGKSFARECVCPRCGKRFKTMVKNQEFCSQACRNAAHWQCRDDKKRANTDGSIEEITLREIYDRDRGRCYICGGRTDWNDYRIVNGFKVVGPHYPSRDHVIALHNGGTHTRENIRLACCSCNSLKSDKGQMCLPIAI